MYYIIQYVFSYKCPSAIIMEFTLFFIPSSKKSSPITLPYLPIPNDFKYIADLESNKFSSSYFWSVYVIKSNSFFH